MRARDARELCSLLRVGRADIFILEVTGMLLRGAEASLASALAAMPSLERIGMGNYLDLLAIRTRVPNYGAPEQARLDGLIPNFMPLAQPSFLRGVFHADIRCREGGRFHRAVIRSRVPLLARYSLATMGGTTSFHTPPKVSWAIAGMRRRLGMGFRDVLRHRFLQQVKEHVLAAAWSDAVSACAPYDVAKIRGLVSAYYSGDIAAGPAVDWWLTFELWRRSLLSV